MAPWAAPRGRIRRVPRSLLEGLEASGPEERVPKRRCRRGPLLEHLTRPTRGGSAERPRRPQLETRAPTSTVLAKRAATRATRFDGLEGAVPCPGALVQGPLRPCSHLCLGQTVSLWTSLLRSPDHLGALRGCNEAGPFSWPLYAPLYGPFSADSWDGPEDGRDLIPIVHRQALETAYFPGGARPRAEDAVPCTLDEGPRTRLKTAPFWPEEPAGPTNRQTNSETEGRVLRRVSGEMPVAACESAL
ncbi:hypothetical protein M885DRAFT_527713 [Pelagophyceae sp. CCMP2097]|nr:hypothetical protein M885DRAFT_527713 [Pelagophyceae sp. CCMP2097]|mmetsp:Transcript_29826/g.102741  ORF Transcript_29826/g.102741 Transcript_29826/m.102741 type:complete len:246 (-) Transcript_29826:1003-1740(-)